MGNRLPADKPPFSNVAKKIENIPPGSIVYYDEKGDLQYRQYSVPLRFKKLRPNAKLPVYSRPGDACMDIHCYENVYIPVGEQKAIPTGIAVELAPGYEMRVRGRGGLTNDGIWCFHGTIDSNYRGEIMVILNNQSDSPWYVDSGSRIAQISVCYVPLWEPMWVEEISETNRGEGRFGSSGV